MPASTLLKLAEAAAKDAGALLRRRGGLTRVAGSYRRDVKLRADRAAEARLLASLAPSELPILSEERGWTGGPAPDGLRWLVDPLDGTFNYLRGLPTCCVSIGLWRSESPVLGVVYDFLREELFSGAVGRGARLNGRRIRPGLAARASEAVFLTGLPASSDFSAARLSRFARDLRRYRKVRLLGSAALSLAYVACGRADAYSEDGILLWDVAGGLALVQAAGGRIAARKTEKLNSLRVYADNGRL